MMQFYFLSVVTNLLIGFMLGFEKKAEEIKYLTEKNNRQGEFHEEHKRYSNTGDSDQLSGFRRRYGACGICDLLFYIACNQHSQQRILDNGYAARRGVRRGACDNA